MEWVHLKTNGLCLSLYNGTDAKMLPCETGKREMIWKINYKGKKKQTCDMFILYVLNPSIKGQPLNFQMLSFPITNQDIYSAT